jgi:hypothetical protein
MWTSAFPKFSTGGCFVEGVKNARNLSDCGKLGGNCFIAKHRGVISDDGDAVFRSSGAMGFS